MTYALAMPAPTNPIGRLKHGAMKLAFRSPFYRMSLKGPAPLSLALVPPDPWPGIAERGRGLIAGQYDFIGIRRIAEAAPWAAADVPEAWLASLHGFDWLRDLKMISGDVSRRTARMLVADWIDRFGGQWSPLAWRPDITGARIANWIGQHNYLLESADDGFRFRVFESLSQQGRHLARTLPGGLTGSALIGAIKGLLYSGLCLSGGEGRLAQALKLLARELPLQILADGGHVERNPSAALTVLRHLVDMRAALRVARHPVPPALQHAIDRLGPCIRFFRHVDQGLALFNGSRAGDPAFIEAVLGQADARGRPFKDASHLGFIRALSGTRTLMLMDIGAPPPPGFDTAAHAGLLAFELSIGRERVFVNCGAPADPGLYEGRLRGTAAHSTLTLGGEDAAEILAHGGIGQRPSKVDWRREEADGAILIEAGHDGYAARLGCHHRRRIYMAPGGEDVRGEDLVTGPAGVPFALRFHLHPQIAASVIQGGGAVLLRGQSAGWRFRCAGGTAEIEESLYFGDSPTPRRSSQIVIRGTTEADVTQLKWSVMRERRGG